MNRFLIMFALLCTTSFFVPRTFAFSTIDAFFPTEMQQIRSTWDQYFPQYRFSDVIYDGIVEFLRRLQDEKREEPIELEIGRTRSMDFSEVAELELEAVKVCSESDECMLVMEDLLFESPVFLDAIGEDSV